MSRLALPLALFTLIALRVPAGAQSTRPTARHILDRVKQQVGVPWKEQTVDTIKAGDPETPVTGVATTMMATLDVLQKAVASGKNLIITHEPTFFGHLDQTGDLEREADPVYTAKAEFIRKHHLVIFRFHDHWHMRHPDGIQAGMTKALGWEKYQDPADEHHFTLPETTVGGLASDLKKRLGVRTMRVVGPADMKLTKVAMAPGAGGFDSQRKLLQRKDVDVLVIGEAREWETVEYAADAATAKQHKALIILGHIPSEQAGMEECARWMRGFVKDVPVEFIPSQEPFWTPR